MAKGVGIVLVVVGHAMRGLRDGGIMAESGAFVFVDRFIYAFHMPLFFFAAGLLLAPRLDRPAAGFVTDKLRTIVYPYVVWSVLQGVLQIVAARGNQALTWGDLARIPWDPIMQFWFLYVLFMGMLVLLALHRMRVPMWGVFLVGVIGAYLPAVVAEWPWLPLQLLCLNFVYLAAGAFLARATVEGVKRLGAVSGLVLGVACLALVGDMVWRFEELRWPLRVLGGAVGVAGVVGLSVAVARLPGSGFVGLLGRWSLQIFVAHTIASAGVRIVLRRAGVEDAGVHLALGIAAGIAIPVLLQWVCLRLGVPWLFAWPARKQQTRPV